jgi:DNA adenine methylase
MVSYIGGKSKIGKWIVPYYPKDIEVYCEPFSGMFWCFFNMDLSHFTKLKTVVYNDFNPLNANLFRCLKKHQLLLNECEKIEVQKKGQPTPEICKQNFNQFQKELFHKDFVIDSSPNYVVAAKYVYILTQVFSGSNPGKSSFIDLKGKYHSKFTSFKNKLKSEKWQRLFERITFVENSDFEDLITKYDSPTTYFYCDPPYYKTEKYYANHEFGLETHQRLADCLKSIKGKFSLSYYDFDQLSEWFPKSDYNWKSKDFHKAAMAKSGKSQTKGTEILIMNYESAKAKEAQLTAVETKDDDFDFSL